MSAADLFRAELAIVLARAADIGSDAAREAAEDAALAVAAAEDALSRGDIRLATEYVTQLADAVVQIGGRHGEATRRAVSTRAQQLGSAALRAIVAAVLA